MAKRKKSHAAKESTALKAMKRACSTHPGFKSKRSRAKCDAAFERYQKLLRTRR